MKKEKISHMMLVLIFMFVAVFLLYIDERWVTDEIISNLFTTIAVSAITTGIFSIFSSFIDKKNMEEKIYSAFPMINVCNEYGLIKISDKFPFDNDEIRKDFIDSKKVYILMNDGKNFITNNLNMINERFQQDKRETNIVLLDYEQDDSIAVLTRKHGHDSTPDYYVKKIKEVISYHFKKEKKSKNHKLKVYLNGNFNTLAIIVSDNYAMISLFRVSTGKDIVPHMIFNKNGTEYEKIKNDVIRVCAESREIDI